MSVTRRQFVRRSAAAAAAIGLPMVASSRVLGANEEIRMAIVGCGVRGGAHIDAFGRQPGVRIVGRLRSRPRAAGVVRQGHRGEVRQPARPRWSTSGSSWTARIST